MEHTERKISSNFDFRGHRKSGSLGVPKVIDQQDLKILQDENSNLRVCRAENASHHRVCSHKISTKFEFTPAKLVEKHPSKSTGQPVQQLVKPPVRIWKQEVEVKAKDSFKAWRPRASIRRHLDGVRALHFTDSMLVSGSEDCTLALWDLRRLRSENMEALGTLRGHGGAVLSLTGQGQHLYSAGVDGSICGWDISSKRQSILLKTAHSDAIWKLDHHPTAQAFLSMSADGNIKLWNEKTVSNKKGEIVYSSEISLPNACSWLSTDHFAVAHGEFLEVVNLHTQVNSKVELKAPTVYDLACQTQSVVVTAHEDRSVRVIDLRSPTVQKAFVAHTDAVTCLDTANQVLVTGGADGSLRTWDNRTWNCLHEVPAHRKKYDEAVLAVKIHNHLLASGGADSIVKIFESR